MTHLTGLLPDTLYLRSLISPDHYTDELATLIDKSLLHPVNDFFCHPGKSIRPRLVEIGYLLAHSEEPQITPELREKIQQASGIVEMIHGGSLIVDDIQDGSEERRNQPSLHLKHGMPLALNAGNWLYFWALRLVKQLELGGMEDLVDLMGKAHMGQALDLGTKIDEIPQAQIKSTCLVSMELKTGALLSLALRLGISIADLEHRRDEILKLGLKLGVLLQMYDDLGNFSVVSSKQYEDLLNRRPTWVWAIASEYSPEVFEQFKEAVYQLPDERALKAWSEEHQFIKRVTNHIQGEIQKLEQYWLEQWHKTHPQSISSLNDLKKLLESSYVKIN